MWDSIIISLILLAAVGYTLHRLFWRHSRGCGCGCARQDPLAFGGRGKKEPDKNGGAPGCGCGR
jgi:hypothetical protein